jgi:hypothetical protein
VEDIFVWYSQCSGRTLLNFEHRYAEAIRLFWVSALVARLPESCEQPSSSGTADLGDIVTRPVRDSSQVRSSPFIRSTRHCDAMCV